MSQVETFNLFIYRHSWDDKHGEGITYTNVAEMMAKVQKLVRFDGDVSKLVVTDSEDFANFHWEEDEGVIYPIELKEIFQDLRAELRNGVKSNA